MISIIVPVYNIEKYVAACIESIIEQTYRDFELLLIDDGSTDSSGKICDEYASKDKRIRVVHKTNGGLVSAWKEGVRLSDGEYTCFVDGDDLVEKDYLSELYENMSDDVDMVCENFSRYWENGEISKVRTNFLEPGTYDCNEELFARCINNNGSRDKIISNNRVSKLSRSSLVKQCSEFCSDEVSFGEDYQMTVCMLMSAKRIRVIDSYKYLYRYNPTSIVNTYKQDLWVRSKKLFETIDKMPHVQDVPNFQKQINTEKLLYFVVCLKNEYYHGKLDKKTFYDLINDGEFINAIQDYYTDNMWRLDKIILDAAKKKKFLRTKTIMRLYRLYCQLRRVHCS